jgi:hypothetical protein
VRNLLATPAATVRISDDSVAARGRLPLPHGSERDRAVRALHAKYGTQVSSTVDDWLGTAYIVALDLDDGAAP